MNASPKEMAAPSSTPPPQVLGYASAQKREPADFGWMLFWYAVAHAVSFVLVLAVVAGLNHGMNPPRFANVILATALLVVIDSVGFALSLRLTRPLRHSKRWLPYLLAALIGAMSVPYVVLAEWVIRGWFTKSFDSSIAFHLLGLLCMLSSFIVTTLGVSCIAILVYRVLVDRPSNSS
jgi:hypothetical protein